MKSFWVAAVLSSCTGTGGGMAQAPEGYRDSGYPMSTAQSVNGYDSPAYGYYSTSSSQKSKAKHRSSIYGDSDLSGYQASSLTTPSYSSLSSKRRSSSYGSNFIPSSSLSQTEQPKRRSWFYWKQEIPSYSGIRPNPYPNAGSAGKTSYSSPYASPYLFSSTSSSSSSKRKSGGLGSSQPYNPLSTNTYTVSPKQFGGHNVTDSYGRSTSVQSDGFGGWKSTSSTGRTAVTDSDGFGGYTTRYGNGSYSNTNRDPLGGGYKTRYSNGYPTTPSSSFRSSTGTGGSLLKGC